LGGPIFVRNQDGFADADQQGQAASTHFVPYIKKTSPHYDPAMKNCYDVLRHEDPAKASMVANALSKMNGGGSNNVNMNALYNNGMMAGGAQSSILPNAGGTAGGGPDRVVRGTSGRTLGEAAAEIPPEELHMQRELLEQMSRGQQQQQMSSSPVVTAEPKNVKTEPSAGTRQQETSIAGALNEIISGREKNIISMTKFLEKMELWRSTVWSPEHPQCPLPSLTPGAESHTAILELVAEDGYADAAFRDGKQYGWRALKNEIEDAEGDHEKQEGIAREFERRWSTRLSMMKFLAKMELWRSQEWSPEHPDCPLPSLAPGEESHCTILHMIAEGHPDAEFRDGKEYGWRALKNEIEDADGDREMQERIAREFAVRWRVREKEWSILELRERERSGALKSYESGKEVASAASGHVQKAQSPFFDPNDPLCIQPVVNNAKEQQHSKSFLVVPPSCGSSAAASPSLGSPADGPHGTPEHLLLAKNGGQMTKEEEDDLAAALEMSMQTKESVRNRSQEPSCSLESSANNGPSTLTSKVVMTSNEVVVPPLVPREPFKLPPPSIPETVPEGECYAGASRGSHGGSTDPFVSNDSFDEERFELEAALKLSLQKDSNAVPDKNDGAAPVFERFIGTPRPSISNDDDAPKGPQTTYAGANVGPENAYAQEDVTKGSSPKFCTSFGCKDGCAGPPSLCGDKIGEDLLRGAREDAQISGFAQIKFRGQSAETVVPVSNGVVLPNVDGKSKEEASSTMMKSLASRLTAMCGGSLCGNTGEKNVQSSTAATDGLGSSSSSSVSATAPATKGGPLPTPGGQPQAFNPQQSAAAAGTFPPAAGVSINNTQQPETTSQHARDEATFDLQHPEPSLLGPNRLLPRSRVRLAGLKSLQFNGRFGRVLRWDVPPAAQDGQLRYEVFFNILLIGTLTPF